MSDSKSFGIGLTWSGCVVLALLALFSLSCGSTASTRPPNDTFAEHDDDAAQPELDAADGTEQQDELSDESDLPDAADGPDELELIEDDSDSDVDSSEDREEDVDKCEGGTLCGQPAVCCPAGNECIDGACLPSCASGVRCGVDGSVCCAAEQLCISQQCARPGASCSDSYDCAQPGEFCEPTLGRCLPQPETVSCEVVPSFEQLTPTIEWSYQAEEVISVPLVADLDGDGVQEVVLNTSVGVTDWPQGTIVVLNGQTGEERWRIPHEPPLSYGSHGRSTAAVGDVNGDGLPDIVYSGRTNLLHAVDGQGSLLWTAHDGAGQPVTLNLSNGAVSLANLDDDPMAEVVLGASLIDHDGTVRWNHEGNGPYYGTNSTYHGGITAVADLDLDGRPELVSGRDAWKLSGSGASLQVSVYWQYSGTDGYPAIADLDLDGKPEVVLVSRGQVIALNGQTGELWCGVDATGAACSSEPGLRTQPIDLPGGGIGGPPTVADFDDDGRPEVGVAGAGSYSVYDFARPGESIPAELPAPLPGQSFVRWSKTTQDQSSNTTGSSVFDFQGDGSSEVIYADECYMRVYDGQSGDVMLQIESSSLTIHEYPIVVDVDSDGNSEILIVSNGTASQCTASGYAGPHAGVYVWGDAEDVWVPTRRVWTQHTYHVTNASSDGNVPFLEENNWSKAGLNNYRQNVQGDGVFNAPDLSIDLSVAQLFCPGNQLELRARVSNLGALGVGPGVRVEFFEGVDAAGVYLGAAQTQAALLPGGSEQVPFMVEAPYTPKDYFARVDGDATGTGVVLECDESNNGEAVTSVACIIN
ncbi:MAG: FG-GAP-like repeat-containing protein [Myxococcota bacterium]|nr:FG-GAP-like repeat-containing protein [Myxococcota bacterium]